MKFKHLIVLLLGMVAAQTTWAQTTPVTVSNITQMKAGKEYYVYIAQPGQTVFSIARAYGLHYSAAVLKTDIHSMTPGDTVWLPVNDQSRAAVSIACGSATAPMPQTKEITIEPKQTLYSISKTYGVTIEQIYELNPSVKDNGLKAGQALILPINATPSSNLNVPSNKPAANTSAPEKKPVTPSQPASKPSSQKPATPVVPAAKVTTTPTNEPTAVLSIRDRISKEKVHITVMMPLYLEKMSEISTTKFDVDQRGKKTYKSLEFIQFYEGILMALETLERQGLNVVLNVVDIPSEDDAAITTAFSTHNIAQSDLIIALLTRKPFQKAAQLAKENRVFIVSPMSTRDEILDNNPYVVKYMPSIESEVKSMLDLVASQYPGTNLFIIHSKSRQEKPYFDEFTRQLQSRTDIKYTFFDWALQGKLASSLKSSTDNVVISIYDQDRDKNRIFANLILNRLNGIQGAAPVLMTTGNFVRDFPDIDYGMLQNLNYHMVYPGFLNYELPNHKDFIERYKARFKTEPMGNYAGVANDLMIYFANALNTRGTAFWNNPSFPRPQGMLFPLNIRQTAPNNGFENQGAVIYRMSDFHLVPARSLY